MLWRTACGCWYWNHFKLNIFIACRYLCHQAFKQRTPSGTLTNHICKCQKKRFLHLKEQPLSKRFPKISSSWGIVKCSDIVDLVSLAFPPLAPSADHVMYFWVLIFWHCSLRFPITELKLSVNKYSTWSVNACNLYYMTRKIWFD